MAGQNQEIQHFSSKELDGLHALYKHITGIETCRNINDLTVKISAYPVWWEIGYNTKLFRPA